MKNLYFFLISILLFSACGRKKLDEEQLNQHESLSDKISWILEKENCELLGINAKGSEFLYDLYKKNNFNAFWVDDSTFLEQGNMIHEILRNKLAFGLPENRYMTDTSATKQMVVQEIILSHTLALMQEDLKFGLFSPGDSSLRACTFPQVDSFRQRIRFETDYHAVAAQILNWGPADSSYRYMAKGLYEFATKYPLHEETFTLPIEKEDSLQAHLMARKSLVSKGHLPADGDSLAYEEALLHFQAMNGLEPDGIIGSKTRTALIESNEKKCQRGAYNLDVLRRRTLDLNRLIQINIPEFTLRFFENDSLKSVHRVVVGTPETATPVLNADLSSLVVYPTWTVPYSIRSKEILPEAKKNPGYFERQHMLVYKGDKQVNPADVDWKSIKENNFPYRVVQQPGTYNALGLIKFQFYNKYNVYIHDTPSKSKFARTLRAYSHGCVRCDQPIELAKKVLLADSNPCIPDSLDARLARKKNDVIRLKHKIPIRLEYRSVICDETLKLTFLCDIYKNDEPYLKILFASNQLALN